MFRKSKTDTPQNVANKPTNKSKSLPSVIASDVHLLGNLVSDAAVDFSGTIDGNIRCDVFTLRADGTVKGEIVANSVFIHGTVKGLIRAKCVNLLRSCSVEGIIFHEQLSIEDGAFVDGKFKRSDRVSTLTTHEKSSDDSETEDAPLIETPKMLENIRLIR